MTRRSTLPPELRRRRRRACWVAWAVVVVVTAATSVAVLLMDGNWEWASLGRFSDRRNDHGPDDLGHPSVRPGAQACDPEQG